MPSMISAGLLANATGLGDIDGATEGGATEGGAAGFGLADGALDAVEGLPLLCPHAAQTIATAPASVAIRPMAEIGRLLIDASCWRSRPA
jgi:hypothetical protein